MYVSDPEESREGVYAGVREFSFRASFIFQTVRRQKRRVDLRLLVALWLPLLCCSYSRQFKMFQYDAITFRRKKRKFCPHKSCCVEIMEKLNGRYIYFVSR